MATPIVMPKQGNTVESVIIVDWKKQIGDSVAVDDVLCEVETDKATMEVPSTVEGTLLTTLFAAGDEVPVMETIAWIGEVGEHAPEGEASASPLMVGVARSPAPATLEPVARAMVAEGGFAVPAQGSGPGGRVTSKDLVKEGEIGRRGDKETASTPAQVVTPAPHPSPLTPAGVEIIPVKGVRKVIAERMLQSLQTTAQLTLDGSADARALQALRKRLKDSPDAMALRGITINDLVLFAVARTLPAFPTLNALFTGAEIHQHRSVHLGVAVDTPRGLMVPVVRSAETLSLRQLSVEAKRLATACLESKITPDELAGGTFTVTNLGAFGVESFTPVLNPPQVAILGICSIQPKPMEMNGEFQFIPHIGLSLTINHQVVDGAPAARFLQALGQAISSIDLLLVG